MINKLHAVRSATAEDGRLAVAALLLLILIALTVATGGPYFTALEAYSEQSR